MTYLTELSSNKKFQGNVVILIGSQYFAIRQPDSGLSIASPYDKSVVSLTLDPSEVDIYKVTTTIASYTFRLLDKNNVISALVAGTATGLLEQSVSIWLGRTGVSMPFSDYFKLPVVKIKQISHEDNSYVISATEDSDRIDRAIYQAFGLLNGDILSGTTTITMSATITGFPASGMLKIENEFISYAGISGANFTGCLRGLNGSTAVGHTAGTEVDLLSVVTGNPIDILLQILISNGGGGAYDLLSDGLGISNTLIDVAGMQALRDKYMSTRQFTLFLSKVDSALKLIEDEILLPNNLRFTYTLSSNSLLTVQILDRAQFTDESKVIDEQTLSQYPKWGVDATQLFNQLVINWDYNAPTDSFNKTSSYSDSTSISTFGKQSPLVLSFKGVLASLGGQAIVDDFATRFLRRLAYPTPRIEITTQVDKSLQNIGEKTYLKSTQVPAADGTLAFQDELEILSRSVNMETAEATFKLAFTSFTGIRSCYIAPSDLVVTVISQKKITVASGRGAQYLAGFVMQLWDMNTGALANAGDIANPITDVTGDTITFQNNFITTLVPTQHRIRFTTYDNASAAQKRYCFINATGSNFPDGKQPYHITV